MVDPSSTDVSMSLDLQEEYTVTKLLCLRTKEELGLF